MTLGELIDKLERCDSGAVVIFDFCGLGPTSFSSYRGYYQDLALGHTKEAGYELTVAELRQQAIECCGKIFYGYKGGKYVASRLTRLWVDNQGYYSGTEIIAIIDCGPCVYIKTENYETAENMRLHAESKELRARIAELEAALKNLENK